MAGLGDDLNNIATAQLVAERHHAAVHLGASAGVSYFGVNGVGKINGRGVAGQHHDFALGSKGVNLFRIKVDLERGKKLAGIGNFLLPLHHLPQPGKALFVLGRNGTVFVLPVGGNAFFRHFMHLLGADLDFAGDAVFRDHGGVQRLVKIGPRHGDEVLDAARHRAPQVMDGAQRRIAIVHRGGENADGEEIVELIHGDALPQNFFVDAVQPLYAALHARLHPVLF